MQWSPPASKTYEKAWGQFFLTCNEWYELDWAQGGHKVQMRGIGVYLVTRQAILDKFADTVRDGFPSANTLIAGSKPVNDANGNQFGTAVHCLSLTFASVQSSYSMQYSPGVIDDYLLCGRDVAGGVWVTVQMYGHSDHIRFTNAFSDGGPMYVSGSTGLLSCVSKEVCAGWPRLRGVVSINTAAAGPVFVNLNGDTTPDMSWVIPPGVDLGNAMDAAGSSAASLGAKVLPQYNPVGYKFEGAALAMTDQDPEYPIGSGGYSGAGFLTALHCAVGH